MRIRQVKPSFWADSRLAALPEATRLFYVGLWMVADDAGWFRWDIAEIAHELYGYEPRPRRERRVQMMFDQLLLADRIVLHECGHAEVPRLGGHQHLAVTDRQVRTAFKEHMGNCGVSRSDSRASVESPRTPAETRGNPRDRAGIPLGKVREGTVEEREEVGVSKGKGKHADGETNDFASAMEAAGFARPRVAS